MIKHLAGELDRQPGLIDKWGAGLALFGCTLYGCQQTPMDAGAIATAAKIGRPPDGFFKFNLPESS